MIQKKTISLILPCRNEGSHLHEVLKLIPDVIDEIIIVSNKSTDDTVKIGKQLAKKDRRIVVIEDNRTTNGIGYGFAHMSGIKAAKSDLIMGADGDATYPIHDIEKIVKFLLKNKYDFISCNRYPLQSGVKIPFKLRIGVGMLNWEIRLLYGIPIKDALSGMWVFKKEVRDKLSLTMGDWNLSPQIKINAARHKNIRFTEFSIAQDQRLGETKQNYFKTGISHAMWILANRFRRGTLQNDRREADA
jgi:glycosyltransferase involved in cell wall biosynthesis